MHAENPVVCDALALRRPRLDASDSVHETTDPFTGHRHVFFGMEGTRLAVVRIAIADGAKTLAAKRGGAEANNLLYIIP
jgi:hypothetical protein